MNSRERVQMALHHERPDRAPINFRSTDIVAENLGKYYGKSYDELLEYYQVDFREVIPSYVGPAFEKSADGTFYDEWGVRRRERITGHSRDLYVDLNPLGDVEDDDDMDKVLGYKWPTPDAYDYSAVERLCDQYEGYAICGPGIHCEGYHGVFHQLTYLFGMENAMILLMSEEEMMQEAVRRVTDFWVGYYDRLLTASKGKMDFIFYKDDMGTQNSLMINRDVFMTYFAPGLKELCDMADSHNATLIYHTCGSVMPLIPDFIDAGVRVLDPIQTSAKNMDIHVLKEKFGDKLTFHGGMDTQQDLPNLKPDAIRELTKETLSVLGKDGGYFFSPSHRIQQDTPLENIDAMYDVALNWNEY